jgi:hypothetical protein
MKRTSIYLLGICVGAFLLRLMLMPLMPHPGIADPNYYYLLGEKLVQGQGFTLDFIWQYNNPPQDIVAPLDYWMPLNGVIVAASFAIFGVNVAAALLPFMLMGAILPVLSFAAAKQLDCEDSGALFAAACTAFLPELLLHSLRSETTLPAAMLICGALVLLTWAFKRGRGYLLLLAGALCGLAYLVRSDAALLLPMGAVVAGIYWLWGRSYFHKRRIAGYLMGAVFVAGIVVAPWLLRNQALFGTFTTPHLERMFFLAHHDDHFAYDEDINLNWLLERQSIGQIVSKRLFELAASIKVMATSLEGFLAICVAGGLLLLIARRDRERLLTIAPTVILILGLLVFYPILIPMKSQGGSFKKAYLALIPMLLPLAAYVLEQAVTDRRLRIGAMLLAVSMLLAFGVDAVRLDSQFVREYLAYTEQALAVVETLPDTNGDGEIRLMSRDPFMFSYFGYKSVVTPYDDRDAVLAVAQRYRIDYLVSPSANPELDKVIVLHQENDPRFERVADVPGTNVVWYRFRPEAAQ